MIINAGFHRKVKGKHEHKNVTGISLPDELWTLDDGQELRRLLMERSPGPGWSLQGYARVDKEAQSD